MSSPASQPATLLQSHPIPKPHRRKTTHPSLTQSRRFTSELAREKMWARIHLIPALQAEEDRDQVRRYLADQQRERELMGGDNFKVYNNERFVKPTFAVTPEKSK